MESTSAAAEVRQVRLQHLGYRCTSQLKATLLCPLQVPIVPALQLPISGVTWSNDLVATPTSAPAAELELAKKPAFKARHSVSMYMDDASTSEPVIEALRSTVR